MTTNRAMVVGVVAALAAGLGVRAGAADRTGYAPVNGLRLYYEIHGTGAPLVLLHGGGSTIDTSFGQILQTLARTRQVIAFDQQGHGRTADVDRPFSFEQSAADAIALLGYLGIERADFFGYSNGGNIALQLGIRNPERVRKLIVASAMFRRDGCAPEFWESFKTASLKDMPAELKDAYLRVAPHPEALPVLFAKSVKRMVEFRDLRPEEIRSIRAPTLVLVGDEDIVRAEHAVEMFRLLPKAELAVLPATNHMQMVGRWPVPTIEAFLDAPMPRAGEPQ